MVSTFTVNKHIEQQGHGDQVDTWDLSENANKAILDLALGSGVNINLTGLSGNQALTAPQYQPMKLILSGAPIAATNIVIPSSVGGLWVVRNLTTGGFSITISSATGGSSVALPVGFNTMVNCDGSASGMFLANSAPAVAGGANTQVQYNNAGTLAGSAGLTWNGTTLATTGINNTGNTVLGDAIGDTVAISGPVTAASTVKSTSGGFIFPDATTLTTGSVLRLYSEVVLAAPANLINVTIPANTKKVEIEFFMGNNVNADFNLAMQAMQGASPFVGTTYSVQTVQATGSSPGAGFNSGISYWSFGTSQNFTGQVSLRYLANGWYGNMNEYAINPTGTVTNFGAAMRCDVTANTITGFQLCGASATTFAIGSFVRCFVVT